MQKYITWQPGNGTRYDLILTQLEVDTVGPKSGSWILVGPWTDRPRVIFLDGATGGILHYSYIAEKFNVGPHDASVIALMVAPHVGREAVTIDNLFEHYTNAPKGQPTVTIGGAE